MDPARKIDGVAVRSIFELPRTTGVSHLGKSRVDTNAQGKPVPDDMFVAIFYGILHTDTGELEYCLGGHNPPYVLSSSGDVHNIDTPVSLIVGTFEGAQFETGHTQLTPGDCLFLFTDGVPEAIDSNGVEFTEERLSTVLHRTIGSPVEQIVASVIDEVRIFSTGTAQSDDITAMALRYCGTE